MDLPVISRQTDRRTDTHFINVAPQYMICVCTQTHTRTHAHAHKLLVSKITCIESHILKYEMHSMQSSKSLLPQHHILKYMQIIRKFLNLQIQNIVSIFLSKHSYLYKTFPPKGKIIIITGFGAAFDYFSICH